MLCCILTVVGLTVQLCGGAVCVSLWRHHDPAPLGAARGAGLFRPYTPSPFDFHHQPLSAPAVGAEDASGAHHRNRLFPSVKSDTVRPVVCVTVKACEQRVLIECRDSQHVV